MGIFSFIKDTGEKIFGGAEVANEKKEAQISEFVTKFGFPVEQFSVNVDGEKATVCGECETGETHEKVVLAVGNVTGIGSVDSQMTVKTPAPEPRFYTVKSGDTLSKISKEYYGDPMKYNMIFDSNKPMLSHPDKIYPGQNLRIPEEQSSATIA